MRISFHFRRTDSEQRRQRGSMLLEVLIAMVVLATGLGGLFSLIAASMYTNNTSSTDTRATMLAEHVLEQISAQPANACGTTLSITDCAGTSWTIATGAAGCSSIGAGNGGSNGGDGANLTSNGNIDWTQAYSSIPAGYAMKYVSCGANGTQNTYDVRWDVIKMSTYSRMVVISARPAQAPTSGGLRFILPVNLRTIGGM